MKENGIEPQNNDVTNFVAAIEKFSKEKN